MDGDAFIVAIVFGSVVSIVFLGVVGSIIKAWVKKGSGSSLSENKEFLAALRDLRRKPTAACQTWKRLLPMKNRLNQNLNQEPQKKYPTRRNRNRLFR